ncbi:TetR/AcrR family transcriptional regulator [Sphingomonas sp.]|uniref:TetR/AcrR family transcriptional regulator n=1 Tax=Sphingomonas sp. TaxID=28214 RepID=UPI002C6165B1|nr:TetR/AcrR family transcriptional regulator [Sphingomonas sp.]HWK36960.1 TetR/AcrR family transcriptional regulator [Sphingomonas sp.]
METGTPLPPPNRTQARRTHLVTTARALFIENGFHRTGMAQIAAASGIKVGQIYRDFRSKDDLIVDICERDLAAWLDEEVLDRAVEAGDMPAVRGWIDRLLLSDKPADDGQLMLEIMAETGRNDRIAGLNQSCEERIRRNLSTALNAIDPRESRAVEHDTLIDFIMAVGVGMMMRRALNPDMNVERLDRYILDIVNQRIDQAVPSPAEAAPREYA